VSPVKYELDFYIPEDDILHSHCCENLKSYKFSYILYNSSSLNEILVLFRFYFVLYCSGLWKTVRRGDDVDIPIASTTVPLVTANVWRG
jgi:hypothetical protein